MNEALETFFANPQIKIILFTAAASLTLALILGLLLGFFKKLFFVKTDPTIQAIRDAGIRDATALQMPVQQGRPPQTAVLQGGQKSQKLFLPYWEWKQTALIEFLFSGVREIVKMQN